MTNLKFTVLSFLTILLIASCGSDSNTLDDKSYLSTLPAAESEDRETIWDAFNREATREPVKVNRYIWQAALDVLDFMPIETIDPFSGVIVKGFGVPPGGKIQYRATIYVIDPTGAEYKIQLDKYSQLRLLKWTAAAAAGGQEQRSSGPFCK